MRACTNNTIILHTRLVSAMILFYLNLIAYSRCCLTLLPGYFRSVFWSQTLEHERSEFNGVYLLRKDSFETSRVKLSEIRLGVRLSREVFYIAQQYHSHVGVVEESGNV